MNTPKKYLDRAKKFLWNKLGRAREYYDPEGLNEIWARMRETLATAVIEVKEKGASSLASALAFLQTPDLLKWTENLTKGAATVYDKAMDAEYLRTHIGGGAHRLFDGGHTIIGSWEAVKDAMKGDSTAQEIVEWTKAYMKDLTTVKGMPFFNLDKADYDKWAGEIARKIPGVSREFLYDLLSFDAMEICAAGFSVVGVFFAFSKEDKEKLAEILGAMGISSIVAANPILGLTTIAVTAYSYWKHGPMDAVAAVKGGGLTAISALIFSIMGLPILVELVIVVVLTTLLKKHIINNEKFIGWLKTKIQDSLSGPKELLNLERLTSLMPTAGEP